MVQAWVKLAVDFWGVKSVRNVEGSAAVCAGGQKREEASPAYITAKPERTAGRQAGRQIAGPQLLLRCLLGPHARINTSRCKKTGTSGIKAADQTERQRAVRQRERHVDTGSHILLFISTSE